MTLLGTGDGIAEISAKRRAQRMLMQLLGLLMAGLGVNWLDSIKNKGVMVGLYCALTSMHLICNQKSLQLVALNWLNEWRLHHVVVHKFLDGVEFDMLGKASRVKVHNA